MAAGEALWANYNGTAFGLYFVLTGLADLISRQSCSGISCLGGGPPTSGFFSVRWCWCPPLPPFGSIPTTLSYVVVVPSAVWSLLVARGLFRIAGQAGGS